MSRAFIKEILRAIKGSLGRFIAIVVIVAIGCGFFAGLRMTGVGMRKSADIYWDQSNLYDIQVVSTLGFSDATVDELAQVPGVTATLPSRSVDVMATFGKEQLASRITTLTPAPDGSGEPNAYLAGTADGTLNQLTLVDGRWPETANECVLLKDEAANIGESGDVQVLYGASDLDGQLKERTFTIVGHVTSPVYSYGAILGITTLGSGQIRQAIYVNQDAFEPDAPYTEVSLGVAGAKDQLAATDAYDDQVAVTEDALDQRLDQIATARRQEVQADAQKELDENRATFEQERADALAQLDDAKRELDDGKAELDRGQAELDEQRALLVNKEQELKDGQAEWEKGAQELADGKAAYQEGLAEWEQQNAQNRPTIQATLQQLEQATTALEQSRAQLEEQHAAGMPEAVYQAALAQLEAEAQKIATGKAQAEAGLTQLDQGKATLDATAKQLEAAQAELDASKAQLDDGQAQIEDGKKQLQDGQATLDEGLAEWQDGYATYQRERADALDELEDAERKLNDAQTEIDDIETPDVFVLTRAQNYGAESYRNDSMRIDNIASVFPFFFFLVSALVSLTTMTRMVEDDRAAIGTYKALGYSTGTISSKYLIYAGSASILGAVIGIVSMSQLLPGVIFDAYGIIYHVPARPFPLPIELEPALAAGLLGLATTLGATLAACLATLREPCAQLMQPKAPKAGKRILLERIGPIWRHMSFSWKVTMRNIFRYKRRFFMTIIGIGGCTALLLTGFGVRNSINDILDKQFNELIHYDCIINLQSDATNGQVQDVIDYLDQSGSVDGVARLLSKNLLAHDEATNKNYQVQTIVTQDPATLQKMVTLRQRISQEPFQLDPDAVLISEKLANTLGAKVGSTVTLYNQSETGNPEGAPKELTITGIIENYLGSYLYVGTDAYAAAFGAPERETTLYANVTTNEQARTALTEGLQTFDQVDTVMFNDETIRTYRSMLDAIDSVMVVLVLAAAALAFVVLYNLANINISERVREIASLKVLGFLPREIDAYIFREILIISAIGAAVGLVLGIALESYVIVTAEVDGAMFGREIHAMSFVYAYMLTMAFCALVLLFMRPKLAHIDMVLSLKSVE